MSYYLILERLLLESRYDSIASSISRKILALIKSSMDEINASEATRTSDGIIAKEFMANSEIEVPLKKNEEPLTISLSAQVIVQRTRAQDTAIAVASAGKDEITFQIKVMSKSGTLSPQHLSLIQARLYEASRHELEHLLQEDDPSIAVSASKFFEKPHVMSRRLAYYTHPQEIPAFVSGMYMRAKKLRKPFIEVLEDNLEKIRRSMEFRGNTPDQIEKTIGKIRKAWMSYAQARYLVA